MVAKISLGYRIKIDQNCGTNNKHLGYYFLSNLIIWAPICTAHAADNSICLRTNLLSFAIF